MMLGYPVSRHIPRDVRSGGCRPARHSYLPDRAAPLSGGLRSRINPCPPFPRITKRQVRRIGGGCSSARPQGKAGSGSAGALEDRDIVRVRVVVPEGFDDPGQPTGGNIYDRRVCAGLAAAGWEVLVATVAAAWPVPGSGARADLARIVSAIPDGETVLIDGLIASPAAAQLLPHIGRIRMTVLLHMPLATAVDTHHDASAESSERAVLRAAAGVVVTSEWTRRQVLTRYEIPACRVHVARPGVDRVAAPAQPVRGHLICVGVLSQHKGQDLLVEALAELADRDWHCVLAGSLDRDPD